MYFFFNRATFQVFVTYLIGALYVHPLWFYIHQHDNRIRSKLFVACQRWWFQWRFWFVTSVPGYLWEEHKPDPWRNPIERNHMGLHLENEMCDKLLKPRQSFRITLYTNLKLKEVSLLFSILMLFMIRLRSGYIFLWPEDGPEQGPKRVVSLKYRIFR